MKFKRSNIISFSATGTTKKIVRKISEKLNFPETVYFDILKERNITLSLHENEIAIFGIPVYSGRVPEIVAETLRDIKGNNTPAILVCAYGNREFDDALVELEDIVTANGFVVVSASAFVARHSIFPTVAANRPSDEDLNQIEDFAIKNKKILTEENYSTENIITKKIDIKGNRPYRPIKKVPLSPVTSRTCNNCGLCIKECPVNAIKSNNPKKTDKNLCIACGHCIAVCAKKAKSFGGLLYWIGSKKFIKNYSEPKDVYMTFRN